MGRILRRAATVTLLIAWLHHPGDADPVAPDHTNPDRVAAPTPWIDLGTSPIIETSEEVVSPPHHPVAAALTLGGMYAGFTTWAYYAWYRHHRQLKDFRWGGDGWFGSR